jgi:hypothetical protein
MGTGVRAPSSPHELQPLNVIFAEHSVQALKAFKVSSTSAAIPHKDGVKRRQVFETIEQRRRSETGRNEMTRDTISLGNVSIDANFDLVITWSVHDTTVPFDDGSSIACQHCKLSRQNSRFLLFMDSRLKYSEITGVP